MFLPLILIVTVALIGLLVALRQHDKRTVPPVAPRTGRRADTTRPVDAPSCSSRGKRARATTTTQVPAPVVCTPATLTTTTSGRWTYRGKLIGAPVAAALMAPVHATSSPVAMAAARYLTTAHKGRHAAPYTRHASGPVRDLAAMLAY